MTTIQKKEALQNGLVHYNFPKKYFVETGDSRIGQKFAIASKMKEGTGIVTHTRYMTYEEFNSFLYGYYAAKVKTFKA